MSLISWNCQGAASREFSRVFKDMVRSYLPSIVGLYEPKVSGSQTDDICRSFGFAQWLWVEAVGFSGGIWVFWTEDFEVEVLSTHPQFVLLKVRSDISNW